MRKIALLVFIFFLSINKTVATAIDEPSIQQAAPDHTEKVQKMDMQERVNSGYTISNNPVNRLALEDLDGGLQKICREIIYLIQTSPDEYVEITYLGLTVDELKSVIDTVKQIYMPYYRSALLFADENKALFLNVERAKEGIEQDAAISEFIRSIIPKLIQPTMSEKEAYLAIHDYVSDYLEYDNSMTISELGTGINTHTGMCGVYADMVCALCNQVGISCERQIGYVIGKDQQQICHAWNKVKIGDNWYYSDVCWDDGLHSETYLLSKNIWNDHIL